MGKNGNRAGSPERQVTLQSRYTSPRTVGGSPNQNREILNGEATQPADEAQGSPDRLYFLARFVRVNPNWLLRRKRQKVRRRANAVPEYFA
jgi:hypothetical protein